MNNILGENKLLDSFFFKESHLFWKFDVPTDRLYHVKKLFYS